MSITDKTRKLLWGRARNRCAFPSCRQELAVRKVSVDTGEEIRSIVGEEAHIRSPLPGGPRYDPDYPKDRLHSYENMVLLCATHHRLVDANGGIGYTVNDLIAMREDHERQQERRERIERTIRAYVAEQYRFDDKVSFEQVDLRGPSVDAMFVDVPFGCRADASVAPLMEEIATEYPGDPEAVDAGNGWVVTGAAQALLHPGWSESALIVGGPGQGKSTLLQYVCQFYRARLLGKDTYTGQQQQLAQVTELTRVAIRIDLRKYARWASTKAKQPRRRQRRGGDIDLEWPSIEQYIAAEVSRRSGDGRRFTAKDLGLLVSTQPVLIALDGLDEVANLPHREQVSVEIVRMHARLDADAANLIVLVATRPGATTSALWSSHEFPTLYLRRLSHGLRVQYLQRWAAVAKLSQTARDKLQQTFMDHQHVPHIRELASYPMQLAILLHLLYRRQLLPQQRTELYQEYLKTFLDREQTADKEPLLNEQRMVIEDIHAFLAWHIQTKAEEGTSAGALERDELARLLRDHLAGREDGQKLAEQLFSAISTRVLCLVERDTGSFQFEVQSLREYFAARYIFENAPPKGEGNSRDDCLNELLRRPYWSNVCRFFVGMFSKVEVRGIRGNLRYLTTKPGLGLHPLLRSTAALLLDDRTYEGQADEPIQDIVDFILEGPGVVLAEDGLLDVAGTALLLAERAGRTQALRHLKDRLVREPSPTVRAAVASSLRRHATAEDQLARWWWDQFDETLPWLDTAADLGALNSLDNQQATKLAKLLAAVSSETVWLPDLLIQGGYDGHAEKILAICKEEINAGAGDALIAADDTPLGRLVQTAWDDQLRTTTRATVDRRASSRTRIRRRHTSNGIQVAPTETGAAPQRNGPGPADPIEPWRRHLSRVAASWGDGWVLRQAAAVPPPDIDLAAIAKSVRGAQPELARLLELEAAARVNKADPNWWRRRLSTSSSLLEQRHWVFSLLSTAHPQVVVDLAGELNDQADQLAAKHFTAIQRGLKATAQSRATRKLVLQEPLRLRQARYTPRALWLLRVVANDGTIEQIDKRIVDGFGALLQPGMGDMRDLLRIVGAAKRIRLDPLHGSRPTLPLGGWASDVQLSVIRTKQANEILQHPHQWPGDLVQRAAELVASQMSADTKPLAIVANENRWFPQR